MLFAFLFVCCIYLGLVCLFFVPLGKCFLYKDNTRQYRKQTSLKIRLTSTIWIIFRKISIFWDLGVKFIVEVFLMASFHFLKTYKIINIHHFQNHQQWPPTLLLRLFSLLMVVKTNIQCSQYQTLTFSNILPPNIFFTKSICSKKWDIQKHRSFMIVSIVIFILLRAIQPN